jgi:type I restriction-modification system DNA methylase subunit
MSAPPFADLNALAGHLRQELQNVQEPKKFILLYAYNGTGKTRLSMAFKDIGKKGGAPDTLYFNAFTEDLFFWDNDLEEDKERVLKLNSTSSFFSGLKELELENRIRPFLNRYTDFDFNIDYEKSEVSFSREVQNGAGTEIIDHIKVSRGEENLFVWCFFLAIVQLSMDRAEAYKWVKYIYIDDPVSTDADTLGDAYEYLIGQFAAGSGKKAGEFYTPQQISSILSGIVTLDSQEPKTGKKAKLDSILDFACGSGSLLLNVRKRMGPHGISKIFGQEKNITTYNLARMNMLLHGVKDSEFEIFHGDTLTNDWEMLRETNPAKKPYFDAVVANPPFSYRWEPTEAIREDVRFKNHGVAPKSAADFAFLLHGFHYLKDEGVMAIILPHGVLFRGGAEERIRTKLLIDGHIDTVIGLPANLFYSTGIPVCILVLKKCKKPDDVLFINASEYFERGKRQNRLRDKDIDKIVETYQFRKEEERYSKRIPMERIKEDGYNLNISRYISSAITESEIDLAATHGVLEMIENTIQKTTVKHNEFLEELGLPPLPSSDSNSSRK